MIKLAVIGTNFITDWLLSTLHLVPEMELYSVYSRDMEKAKAFGSKHGVSVCYDQLEQLAADQEVDAVYIASPNYCHCGQAVQMMEAGKHVLVEKSIASNSQEYARMEQAARENHVVMLEAIRSVYDPAFQKLREELPKIGKIRQVTFQFCQYSSRYDNFKKGIIENAFKPELSNGALMDIGVYCVHPLVALFGKPDSIKADTIFLDNGVDGAGTILAHYEDGMQASLIYSKISQNHMPSQILGENGYIQIEKIHELRSIKVVTRDGSEVLHPFEDEIVNMVYELKELARLILSGDSIETYLENSRNELYVMDEARRQTGMKFPADEI